MSKLLPLARAAAALDVDRGTLTSWRKRGMPTSPGKGGAVLVDVAKVRAWARSQGLSGAAGRPLGSISDPTAALGAPTPPASPEPAAAPPADTPGPDAERAELEAKIRGEIEAQHAGASAALREEIAKLEVAKRRLEVAKLEAQQREKAGLMVDRQEVERTQVEAIKLTKGGLLALAHTLALRLPGRTAQEVREEVSAEVDSLLRRFAEEFAPL